MHGFMAVTTRESAMYELAPVASMQAIKESVVAENGSLSSIVVRITARHAVDGGSIPP